MDTQGASRPLLETAQTYFQQKKYDLCLLSLHTLAQAGGTGDADAQALTVICKIHKHAALQEWHKVLGISRDATEAEAKRQYRKLAAVVHPDKCALEGSEEAFKLLSKSAACLTPQSSTNSGDEEQATDEGPVAPWWENWDDVDVPSRKRKHPTSKPSAEDTQEDHELAGLSLQELQAEVRRRQAAVLRPEPGTEEEGLNAFQRQKRLRFRLLAQF
ncbi:hypothetical protein ABBQ38_001223 [Trebouxia sp. C0009 RCD-2024]